MRIQHNIMAMNAYRNYNTNTSALSKNLEKLSSGYKINRAGDDAAGLAISEKMRAQITGLNAAQKNVKDGISLVKTAEGAMQEIQDMLNRMDYLATQSANGTYDNEVDRANLQKEVDALKTEINRIADSANFNGIKLLDGSLAKGATPTSIEIGGNLMAAKSAGAKGVYTSTENVDAMIGVLDNNVDGSMEYTVSLNNGKSYAVNLTMRENPDQAGAYQLVSGDGTIYDYAGNDDVYSAIHQELNKSALKNDFSIKNNGDGTFTFTAAKEGLENPEVTAIDGQVKNAAGEVVADGGSGEGKIGVTIDVQARNEGKEIAADDILLYNGKNYDDAVFTINGKKFVVMVSEEQGANLGKDSPNMNATEGLGKDVTVLVADSAANKGLKAADKNFIQNIKKIAEVTGLSVGDAINEVDATGAAAATGVAPGAGIRLSIGKGTVDNSLTLQIGDTADDFNQMKVSIGDMHTKAMGIAGIDISTQEGAAAAVQTVKDAINYVSSIRGDLGAIQNRLEHTGNNLSVMAENIQDAESTIRDTDVAEEMMSYVKNNILVQSAQAMLAQANQVPQGVLQLLG